MLSLLTPDTDTLLRGVDSYSLMAYIDVTWVYLLLLTRCIRAATSTYIVLSRYEPVSPVRLGYSQSSLYHWMLLLLSTVAYIYLSM